MDDLEKKNSDLEFPNKMDDTDQEQEDIKQKMSESSEGLGEKKRKKSFEEEVES